MKIDIFNHIFPKKYYDKYIDAGQSGKDMGKRVANIKTIVDVDSRFRALDPLGDYVQVITLPVLPMKSWRDRRNPLNWQGTATMVSLNW